MKEIPRQQGGINTPESCISFSFFTLISPLKVNEKNRKNTEKIHSFSLSLSFFHPFHPIPRNLLFLGFLRVCVWGGVKKVKEMAWRQSELARLPKLPLVARWWRSNKNAVGGVRQKRSETQATAKPMVTNGPSTRQDWRRQPKRV